MAEITVSEAEDREIRAQPPQFGAHIKLEQRSIRPWDTKVWLNGQDITSSLTRVEIIWNGHDITVAKLTIGVREIEIDADTLMHLQAVYMDKKHGH